MNHRWTQIDTDKGRPKVESLAWELLRRLGLPLIAATLVRSGLAAEFHGQPFSGSDVFADTWVATDGAGRIVPGFAECGPPRTNKWVGIFYWTWHRPTDSGPNDNTKLLALASNGIVPWPQNGAPYHWGEPELGYYLMTDPFVIRKHASMLSDAGVDVILFDTTNPPFTWKEEYEALCREYTEMRHQGARTPAIAFIAPFGDPRAVTDQLWRELYKPGLWKDLWFEHFRVFDELFVGQQQRLGVPDIAVGIMAASTPAREQSCSD